MLCSICVTNGPGYVPFVVITILSFPHSWLITGFVAREYYMGATCGTGNAYPSGAPFFIWVRITQSVVFSVVFYWPLFVCLSFCYHCIVCPSNYCFWLSLRYFQTFHTKYCGFQWVLIVMIHLQYFWKLC